MIIGTLLNSQHNRCILLGYHQNLFKISKNLNFEANYIYSGEFFFDEFSKCGDGGVYKVVRKTTGIGFVPYLYHGFDYKVSDSMSLEMGNIFPNIITFGLQFHY